MSASVKPKLAKQMPEMKYRIVITPLHGEAIRAYAALKSEAKREANYHTRKGQPISTKAQVYEHDGVNYTQLRYEVRVGTDGKRVEVTI